MSIPVQHRPSPAVPDASEADIEAKFERLLVVDRSSAEFEALWQEIDAWLSAAIARAGHPVHSSF